MRRSDVASAYSILAGEHLLDAGKGERVFCVYGDELRVRPVAAHEMGVELARRVPVGGVPAGARDEADVFYAAAVVMVVGFVTHSICLLGEVKRRCRSVSADTAR